VTGYKHTFLLILILVLITSISSGIAVQQLYFTSIQQQKARLVETAKSKAELIEAVGRFNVMDCSDYPGGPTKATLDQILEAHENFEGFGETGEFTLAKLEHDSIVFLLSHRHSDLKVPNPVAFNSKLAEPMRQALSGNSGIIEGLDYRGVKVIAAYEPVNFLNSGIVTKVDKKEIQAPFKKAILVT